MSQAGRDKLLLGDQTVSIPVHLSKGGLDDCLLTHIRLLGLQEEVHVPHQPLHLLLADLPVVVEVEYSEKVLETLLGGSLSEGVVDHAELSEVYAATVVSIEDPEHMILHLLDISAGLRYAEHLPELLPPNLAVSIDGEEITEIALDLRPLHPTPLYEALDTVLCQHRFASPGPHTRLSKGSLYW